MYTAGKFGEPSMICQTKTALISTYQRHRERGFEGIGQTPLSNQDLIIASYLDSFNIKPSQV